VLSRLLLATFIAKAETAIEEEEELGMTDGLFEKR
jgi:hypothetical protein